MPDSTAVDAAVIAKLLNDAPLVAATPDGIYWDIAPQGKTKFVIVSQLSHEDAYVFRGSLSERFLYLVKAVAKGTSVPEVQTAATRIHAVLQDGSLAIAGYSSVNVQRLERVRYTELDDADGALWQHRGGQYEVVAFA